MPIGQGELDCRRGTRSADQRRTAEDTRFTRTGKHGQSVRMETTLGRASSTRRCMRTSVRQLRRRGQEQLYLIVNA